MTCSTYHATHGLPRISTNGPTARGANGDKTRALLIKKSPDICGECHRNKFTIANSKHDLSKVEPAKDTLKKRPAESGLCGGCHLVHGTEKGFLWLRREGPAVKNVGDAEEFCIGCHHESGLAGKKVINKYSHPVNISPAEKELATTLPLFDGNGRVSRNGVMTCQTCHDPHKWSPVKPSAGDHFDHEGNAQNSFLRLENSPSPRLCSNCHQKQATVERTDHDLTITAASHKNIMGQTPADSGTCGVCHLVHNGKNQVKLWGQKFGEGTNVMERMCNSCHEEGGSAKEKIPLIATHPQGKIVNLGKDIQGKVTYLPLFDDSSGEPVTVGSISCASCHNVHQWDPRAPTKGKGVNVEGNATNSFLRVRSPNLMCKDCHGFNALVKFKFYHDPIMRKTEGVLNIPR